MEACLVMRNNLKRIFKNKYTYLVLILVPLVLTGIGELANGISDKTVRVGLVDSMQEIAEQEEEGQKQEVEEQKERAESMQEIQVQLDGCEYVQYQIADYDTVQTDFIMGKYHYVIDTSHIDESKKTLEEIMGKDENIREGTNNALPATDRFIAMLVTAYLVIATVYASKFIQDRQQGMLERVRATGMTTGQYLLGYVLSTEIIVMIQIGISIICFSLFHHGSGMELGKMIILIVVISVMTTLYAVILVLLCRREMTANIMASSIAVLLSILGGTFVTVSQMPLVLQRLSVISPIRWILEWL